MATCGETPTEVQISDFEAAAIASVTREGESSGFEAFFDRKMFHPEIQSHSYLGNFVPILDIGGEETPAIFSFDVIADDTTNHRIRALHRDGTTTDYPLAADGELVAIGLQVDGLETQSFFEIQLCGLPDGVDTIFSRRWFEVDWEEGYDNIEWMTLLEAAGYTDKCFWPDVQEGTSNYLFDGVARRFEVTTPDSTFIGRMIHNPFDYDENFIRWSPEDDATLTDQGWVIDIIDHPLYESGIQKVQLDDGNYYYPAIQQVVKKIISRDNLDADSFNDCP